MKSLFFHISSKDDNHSFYDSETFKQLKTPVKDFIQKCASKTDTGISCMINGLDQHDKELHIHLQAKKEDIRNELDKYFFYYSINEYKGKVHAVVDI